jgi:GTPase
LLLLIHQVLHKGKDLLNIKIDQIAQSVLKEVDLILFVVDSKKGAAETKVIEYFQHFDVPVFLVINKIDDTQK